MNCPFCNGSSVKSRSDHREDVKIGRRTISVDGLRHYVCANCGESFMTPDQHDANLKRIKAATASLVPISPKEIREIRSRIGLSQSEAQRIFGGGANAFSKYENGKVVPAESLAKLLRLAADIPEVLRRLAADAGVQLTNQPISSSNVTEGTVTFGVGTWIRPLTDSNLHVLLGADVMQVDDYRTTGPYSVRGQIEWKSEIDPLFIRSGGRVRNPVRSH